MVHNEHPKGRYSFCDCVRSRFGRPLSSKQKPWPSMNPTPPSSLQGALQESMKQERLQVRIMDDDANHAPAKAAPPSPTKPALLDQTVDTTSVCTSEDEEDEEYVVQQLQDVNHLIQTRQYDAITSLPPDYTAIPLDALDSTAVHLAAADATVPPELLHQLMELNTSTTTTTYATDRDGNTAWHLACANQACVSTLAFLCPVEQTDTNNYGDTALHLLLCNPLLYSDEIPFADEWAGGQLVRRMLEASPSLVDTTNHSGHTPLHIACAKGVHASVLKVILDHAVHLDAVDRNGCTALDYAVQHGCVFHDLVATLIERLQPNATKLVKCMRLLLQDCSSSIGVNRNVVHVLRLLLDYHTEPLPASVMAAISINTPASLTRLIYRHSIDLCAAVKSKAVDVSHVIRQVLQVQSDAIHQVDTKGRTVLECALWNGSSSKRTLQLVHLLLPQTTVTSTALQHTLLCHVRIAKQVLKHTDETVLRSVLETTELTVAPNMRALIRQVLPDAFCAEC